MSPKPTFVKSPDRLTPVPQHQISSRILPLYILAWRSSVVSYRQTPIWRLYHQESSSTGRKLYSQPKESSYNNHIYPMNSDINLSKKLREVPLISLARKVPWGKFGTISPKTTLLPQTPSKVTESFCYVYPPSACNTLYSPTSPKGLGTKPSNIFGRPSTKLSTKWPSKSKKRNFARAPSSSTTNKQRPGGRYLMIPEAPFS